ncbi:MAG: hypothetical protein WC769_09275 [Thermodesulfovibrionales bacterium]|jgi:hypothetical protein
MSIINRKTVVSILICLFFLLACDEKPKNPVAEYGDALVNSYKRSQQAAEEANLDALKKAVQLYYASNERFPKNLNEAKEFISPDMDLSKYDYSPDTGTVSLKK